MVILLERWLDEVAAPSLIGHYCAIHTEYIYIHIIKIEVNKKKVIAYLYVALEFGSVNLDHAGSVLVFSILQVLRFSGSLNLELP
jgi:hypothetical protein